MSRAEGEIRGLFMVTSILRVLGPFLMEEIKQDGAFALGAFWILL